MDTRAPTPAVIADIHLHTRHSHGIASTAEMYEACRARGLSIIGFSEHSPRPDGYAYPTDYQDKLSAGFPDYIREVTELAARGVHDNVTVLLGLEIDYIPGQEAYAEALRRAYDYDYYIGGLHFQGNWGFDFTADDWAVLQESACMEAYAQYYRDLASMCRSGLFHIAAHPDLIKLFTVDTFHSWLSHPEASRLIGDALDAMKENGMLMEISSAGLRKPCKEIYPCPQIMAMAAERQLPISFASDAHCTNTPAYAFDELAGYAARYGYTKSAIIRNGTVHPLPFATPPVLTPLP